MISIWLSLQRSITLHGVSPSESGNPSGNEAGLASRARIITAEVCTSADNPKRLRPQRPIKNGIKSLEAALLVKMRYKKSFDKLPLSVQRLARPAFSAVENGPLLWDL